MKLRARIVRADTDLAGYLSDGRVAQRSGTVDPFRHLIHRSRSADLALRMQLLRIARPHAHDARHRCAALNRAVGKHDPLAGANESVDLESRLRLIRADAEVPFRGQTHCLDVFPIEKVPEAKGEIAARRHDLSSLTVMESCRELEVLRRTVDADSLRRHTQSSLLLGGVPLEIHGEDPHRVRSIR